MNISLDWISDFIPLDLVDKDSLKNVVVGYVKEMEKHSGADTLNVAQVDLGDETVQIVCGGVNLKKGVYVLVAKVGAVLPGNFAIQASKIRGESSHGMICAKEELGLGKGGPHEIWILDEKKKWAPGAPAVEALELKGLSPKELAILLTKHTAEVEGVHKEDEALSRVVTGKLLEFKKIEGSEKLHVGQFDLGWKKVQVIFGSVHVLHEGDILPIALAGAKLPGGDIKVTEMLGVKSEGMVCSDAELGIHNTEEGLTRFPTKTELGIPVAEALHKQGWIIEIDNKSLTHRPDLWGHYGIARELAAILGTKLAPLDKLLKVPAAKGKTVATVDIQDKALCPRFSSAIVTGIKIEESPQWMKSRLQAAGMNAHNNIVDITNYVMLELGQPMHAYDRETIGDTLKVRFAKKGEKLLTLEGGEHALTTEDPVITNGADQAIGLAGVKGGLHSGIRNETTELVLEAAAFDAIVVRKAAVRHGLRTDASQRFEKNLDPTLTELAIQRAVNLIMELCPSAKLEGPIQTVGSWKPSTKTISIDPERLCSKIGVDIETSEISRILESLEFDVAKDGKKLKVTVPAHRATRDVSIEEDLVEEVARIYGYDKIAPVLPSLPTILPMENMERELKHQARTIFAGNLGFTEVMTYSFYGKDRLEKCGLEEKDHLRVLNYLSLDQTHMRCSLTPNILATVATNARERESMKIFELGHTYKEVGEFMPLEEKRLTAAVALKGESFYEAKGALESFLEAFRVTRYELKPSKKTLPYAHPKMSMDLIVKGKTVGVLFTVHPSTLKAFDIPHSVSVFSVHFSDLVQTGRELQKFTPLAKFPSVPFDISVLTDRRENVDQVEKILRSADKEKLIVSVELFDIYEGKNIPEDKKSLSFRVVLRHNERTLTDAEFQTLYASVTAALEKAGFTIRGL